MINVIYDSNRAGTVNISNLSFKSEKQRGFTHASTKSHASGKIKTRYFRILRIGSDVFFDADFDAPHMTWSKNTTLRSYRQKTAFIEAT